MTAFLYPRGDESGFGHTFPALYNVVYCSRATPDMNEAAVQRIIATARRWNPEHGVTGMLVFGSGIFFQWLEGPRDNVMALMSRLRDDRRHDSIVLLSEVEDVRERLFPDWIWNLLLATIFAMCCRTPWTAPPTRRTRRPSASCWPNSMRAGCATSTPPEPTAPMHGARVLKAK
jgi:hypothetical protein